MQYWSSQAAVLCCSSCSCFIARQLLSNSGSNDRLLTKSVQLENPRLQSLGRISKLSLKKCHYISTDECILSVHTKHVYVHVMWKNLPFGEKCRCLARALSTSRKAFVKTFSRLDSSATRSLKQQPNNYALLTTHHIHAQITDRYVITTYLTTSLLDEFLHIFLTEVSCF